MSLPTIEQLRSQVLQIPASVTQAVRILQITDCHLGETEGEQLVGMDTDVSLDHVLALIEQEQFGGSATLPQLLLATGDLSNNGSTEAYQRLARKLQPLSLPLAWLSGNHDSAELMRDAVGPLLLPPLVLMGRWAIILLDSAVPGEVGGTLGSEELKKLELLLQLASDAEHVLVCLHHQPVPIGCAWLDQQQLSDSEAFFAILQNEPRLRGILWGHVHQDFSGTDPRVPGVELLASPSTCIQFAPHQQSFKLDEQSPGYRWLDLHPDGSLVTEVSRLSNVELSIDFASTGY